MTDETPRPAARGESATKADEERPADLTIVWVVALALILGMLVLAVKPSYRIANNIESNEDLYPTVDASFE